MKSAGELRSGKGHRDENFPVASRLLAKRHRPAILAFYRFARLADDVADHPTLGSDEKLALLGSLEATLLGRNDAEKEGLDVTFDCYSYPYSGTRATILLPQWTMEGGPERLKRALRDPADRERIRSELRDSPAIRVRYDENWLTNYRDWVHGTGFGFQLGLGAVTIVTSASLYLTWLLELLLARPFASAVIGATFGLARALPLLTTASAIDPPSLRTAHRRWQAWQSPVSAATTAVSVLAGAALLAAAL